MSASPTIRRSPGPGALAAVVLALLAALAGTIPAAAAPSAARSVEVQVSAGDRSFPAVAWLPDPATTGASPAPGGPPWPVVVFGHGYLSPVEVYASLLSGVASDGFVVIAPRSGGELFPDHASFAADLSAVVDWLAADGTAPGGPLAGLADPTRVAVSGHSMGGGAATLAAAADPRFATLATLAAAETRPSAVAAAADIRVPSLLIGGELDTIAPVAAHQRPIFEAIAGAPAQLRIITGGSHCGFTDIAAGAGGGLLGRLGSVVCDTATIPVDSQIAIARTLLTDWLRVQLAGDTTGAEAIWTAAPGDGTTIEVRQPPT